MRLLMHPLYGYLARGLEQELFFLGQDALGKQKSLLVEYGFERRPKPYGRGSHRYRMDRSGAVLELHSFCFGLYPDESDGFLFIRAGSKAVLYLGSSPAVPGSYKEDLMLLPTDLVLWKKFHTASSAFLEWVEEYEEWVQRRMGAEYRIHAQKHSPSPWLAPADARAWFRLYRNDPAAALRSVPADGLDSPRAALAASRRVWKRVGARLAAPARWLAPDTTAETNDRYKVQEQEG
jgi:hypothetical protein